VGEVGRDGEYETCCLDILTGPEQSGRSCSMKGMVLMGLGSIIMQESCTAREFSYLFHSWSKALQRVRSSCVGEMTMRSIPRRRSGTLLKRSTSKGCGLGASMRSLQCEKYLTNHKRSEDKTDTKQNKPDPELNLGSGGSIINVASFVAIMGAATPQLACTSDLQR